MILLLQDLITLLIHLRKQLYKERDYILYKILKKINFIHQYFKKTNFSNKKLKN